MNSFSLPFRLKLTVALGVNLIFCLFPAKGESFAPLKKATVEELSGDVTIRKETDTTNRKAILKDVVSGKDVIHTGKKSRTELEFADKSLCRLGSNTVFSFDPSSRNMAVSQGVAVVHVPPGNGGARIATPAATAAISGDTLICSCYKMPDGSMATKFMALSPHGGPTQGNIVITLANNPGVFIPLGAGQVAVIPANATSRAQVPVVEIDVARFTSRSPILQSLPPTAGQEMKTITMAQAQAFASGIAIPTLFAIVGTGDQLVNLGAFPPTGSPLPPTGPVPAPGTMPSPPNGMTTSGTLTGPTGTVVFDPTTGTYTTINPTTTQPLTLTGGGGTLVYNSIIYLPPPGVIPGANLALPPPGVLNFYFGGTGGQFSLVNATIDTMAGTINGMGPSPTTFGYSAATPGLGLFGFDKLTLSGTINVSGGNILGLHTFNNSGTSTAGSAITIGSTTFSFAANTPNTVNMTARGNGGDIVVTGNVNAPSASLELYAPVSVAGGPTPPPTSGNITMGASSSINMTGAAPGDHGGSLNINSANNICLQSIQANGINGNMGGNAGSVSVNSMSGTVTLNNRVDANGGTSSAVGATGGSGGNVSVSGSSISTAGAFSVNAIGANTSGGGTGGAGGSINLAGGGNPLALVSGNILIATGGMATTGNAAGGAGGSVNLTGGNISLPTGATLSAMGGNGVGTGAGGSGGSAILSAGSTISLTTATGGSIISAAGGMGASTTGGFIKLNAPTSVTVSSNTTTPPATINAGTGGTVSIPGAPITYTGAGPATHNP